MRHSANRRSPTSRKIHLPIEDRNRHQHKLITRTTPSPIRGSATNTHRSTVPRPRQSPYTTPEAREFEAFCQLAWKQLVAPPLSNSSGEPGVSRPLFSSSSTSVDGPAGLSGYPNEQSRANRCRRSFTSSVARADSGTSPAPALSDALRSGRAFVHEVGGHVDGHRALLRRGKNIDHVTHTHLAADRVTPEARAPRGL